MDKLEVLNPAHKHMHRIVLGIQLWREALANIFSCILVLMSLLFSIFNLVVASGQSKNKRKVKCHCCCVPGFSLLLEELCKFRTTVQTVLKVFKFYIIPC